MSIVIKYHNIKLLIRSVYINSMIIWLASYPKSGNTWIRSLLTSYLFSKDGKFEFKLLNNIKQFSIHDVTQKTKNNTNDQSKLPENWIPAQIKINQDGKIRLFKTHNAICTINENKFTDKENTKAAIYITRDPRNLITSLSHHYDLTLDDSYSFLINERKIIYPKSELINGDIKKFNEYNFLGDWGNHYNSWKNINFCPIKVIRYEDFILDVEKSFLSIIDFLSKFIKIEIVNKKIINAINSTSFENLSKMETLQNFEESVTSKKTKKRIKFFNLGKKNDWNKLLDKKIVNKIESRFKNEMKELGYL